MSSRRTRISVNINKQLLSLETNSNQQVHQEQSPSTRTAGSYSCTNGTGYRYS